MSGKTINRRDFMRGAVASGAGLGLWGAAASDAQPAPQGKVPRKKLGATGAEIPILLMGGSQNFDPRYDRCLHLAFQLGVNYIDTAQSYSNGQSHKTLAPFLKQIGDRKNLWITSKVGLHGPLATPQNFMSNLDRCLADLETDYLDMFFMHGINEEWVLEPEFIQMGETLKRQRKIRFFGFSCHDGNVPQMITKAARVGSIDAIQFRYNFRKYGDLELNKAMDAARASGIGLIAMKTQASVPDDQEKVIAFQSKAFNLPQAKLKAIWADERIDACVSEMTNIEQVRQNTAAAMSPVQLTMKEFTQLNRLAALTASHHCNGCNHLCESRIQGNLRVADTLRYLMYYESYKNRETARRLYAALRPEERDPHAVDLRAATAACPQGIDLARRLAEAKRLLA